MIVLTYLRGTDKPLNANFALVDGLQADEHAGYRGVIGMIFIEKPLCGADIFVRDGCMNAETLSVVPKLD